MNRIFVNHFTLSVFCHVERDDYRYSGSENEEDEPALAGEASSIVQAPGGDTLRRNFQQIQEGRTLTQEVNPQPSAAKEKSSNRAQRDIPEPGPPARPAIPHRLIGRFDSISLIVVCVFFFILYAKSQVSCLNCYVITFKMYSSSRSTTTISTITSNT